MNSWIRICFIDLQQLASFLFCLSCSATTMVIHNIMKWEQLLYFFIINYLLLLLFYYCYVVKKLNVAKCNKCRNGKFKIEVVLSFINCNLPYAAVNWSIQNMLRYLWWFPFLLQCNYIAFHFYQYFFSPTFEKINLGFSCSFNWVGYFMMTECSGSNAFF